MIRLGLIAGLMFACNGDKNTDSGDTTGSQLCEITVDSTYPVSGSNNFYIQDSLVFELSDDDATASLMLKDADGTDVAGTSSVDGDTITFAPSATLTPSTSYTAELTYCGDEDPVQVNFDTSSLGEALEVDLVGKTYAVDLGSGNFVEPAGVGELIGGLLENNILIGITEVTDSVLKIRGAISVESSTDQDFCTETLEEFPDADFSAAPYFEIPEGDVTLSVAGFEATIHSLSVAGTFAADGSEFGGGELSGELDAREILPLLGDAGLDAETPDDVCNLLLGFGVQCVPCSADTEPYCITLVVDRLVAAETGNSIGLVCEGDCHESCESNADECAEPQITEINECPAE